MRVLWLVTAPGWAHGEADNAAAVQRYRRWITGQAQLIARLPELRGKALGCWRAPLDGLYGDLNGRMCHGEFLAVLADGLTQAWRPNSAVICPRLTFRR